MAMKYLKIWYDWPETTEYLTAAQKGRLIDALVKYARGDADAAASLKGAALALFPAFKRQIDQDTEQYAAQTERNRENGKKGGRPRKEAEETQENPENPVGFSETQVVFQKTQKSQEKRIKNKDKDKEEDKDTLFKKKIDNNWKHSRKARAATAQVIVDQIVEDELPFAGYPELYDMIAEALEKGTSPERIYAAALEADSTNFGYLLYIAEKEAGHG